MYTMDKLWHNDYLPSSGYGLLENSSFSFSSHCVGWEEREEGFLLLSCFMSAEVEELEKVEEESVNSGYSV